MRLSGLTWNEPNDETNNANEHNMVKNPNLGKADQSFALALQ